MLLTICGSVSVLFENFAESHSYSNTTIC